MSTNSVIDRVVREINTRRAYVPVIYIETENRNLIYEILKRKDCFITLHKEDDAIKPGADIEPGMSDKKLKDTNICFLTSNYKSELKNNNKNEWKDYPVYYIVRDFQTWDSDSQRTLIKNYIEIVYENNSNVPLKQNLVIISSVQMSVGNETECCPYGFEQFVNVIDVPLIGIHEFAEMITEVQNKALRNVNVEIITIEDYLLLPDDYIEEFKGLNHEHVKNILHQLQNEFGIVSYVGVPERLRKAIPYKEIKERVIELIRDHKKQEIEKAGDVEYFDTDALDEPGGMEGIQKWIEKKRLILDNPERAQLYGVRFPKGVLIAGIPGSGKSLIAKNIAKELGINLIQFKMDMVLQKHVGDSEQRLKNVLKLFEASAPVVIWIDEIEKEFSGMNGNGESDGGVNKRCLAKILNWMQENEEKCFVCATANHTENLPSELLRRGRFDRLYYSFLPMYEQCVDIMFKHMEKLKTEKKYLFEDNVSKDDIRNVCKNVMDNVAEYERKFFTGSDIKGLIEDAQAQLFEDVSKDRPTLNDWKEVLIKQVETSSAYSETNYQDVLDYWIGLKFQVFRNAAVPEDVKGDDKYEYMLFDFSDLIVDGQSWKWRETLECRSQYLYDKKMFETLKTDILKRITTQK